GGGGSDGETGGSRRRKSAEVAGNETVLIAPRARREIGGARAQPRRQRIGDNDIDSVLRTAIGDDQRVRYGSADQDRIGGGGFGEPDVSDGQNDGRDGRGGIIGGMSIG